VAETISTNQFKTGMHIDVEGDAWRIVDFQHVKPGKGGAFVRTKLKSVKNGSVVEKTFRAGEKFTRIHTEVRNAQYLYEAGDDVHFMDQENFDQFILSKGAIDDALDYMLPSETVQILSLDGVPMSVQLSASVELTVTDTEPAVKGDTVSNVTKPATVETGAIIQVPMFVEIGERIKVDTRDRRYISRV
jgi:elongation factor P